MKLTFRWYGGSDPVTLGQIRQIPCMSGIVSAVYDTPPGEVWKRESIAALKQQAFEAGLAFEVVESVPVHEEIKLGGPQAVRYLDAYCENLRRLGEAGVKVVCYNFMPVFDWLRSDLSHRRRDGSTALAYCETDIGKMDPMKEGLSLPGWDESYTKEELRGLLRRYEGMDGEALWKNYAAFLEAVIPAAETAGIKMAVHPDDPPWGLFGLPRILTGEESFARLRRLQPSLSNGITLCTGSLGADPKNDLPHMAEAFCEAIPFVHLRNILRTGERCFEEAPHPSACGSLDLYAIVQSLVRNGFDGYVRPDHGRMIWGEEGKPGYGLYDRALGAAYLVGLFEAAEAQSKNKS